MTVAFAYGLSRTVLMFALACGTMAAIAAADTAPRVPILLYHRLGPVVGDSMTVTTPVFEAQLNLLRQRNLRVIPARQLVDAMREAGAALPERAVVIMVDDGHRSI